MVSIFQLLCFVTLSGTATFSEAAEKLYLSQSSLSNNIQTIEREFGVSLVTRERGTLSLTEAGFAFLAYAKSIVDEYDNINELLKDYKQSSENRVLIYTDPLSSYGYNRMLTGFKLNFSDIQTEIVELENESFDDVISTQKDAVGIVFSTEKQTSPGKKCLTIASDKLAVLVSKTHNLAKCKHVLPGQLQDEVLQIISYRQSPFLNDFTMAQFDKAGFKPNAAPFDLWYNTARETIRELGIPAVFPERVANIFCEQDMKVIDLDTEQFHINVVISEDCTHNAALKFYEFAVAFLDANAPHPSA